MTKRAKSPDGAGHYPGFMLHFNLDDEDEYRAWQIAQQLATPHGRRKRIIIGFLLAIDRYQRETGRDLNADTVVEAFFADALLGQRVQADKKPPEILIENVEFADEGESDKMAQNFGSLFE